MSTGRPEEGAAVALPVQSHGQVQRLARRMAWLYLAAGVILLPWIVYLALTLPEHNVADHYRLAWVGFDVLLAAAVFRTAWLAFRVDPRVRFAATATAVLLFVDAWFDVTTSGNRAEMTEALVLAAFVELPAAVFSLVVAHRVNRRAGQLVLLRAEAAVRAEREQAAPAGAGGDVARAGGTPADAAPA